MLKATELEGRTALVTGAASGIGREVSHALARNGANVACFDLATSEKADPTLRDLTEQTLNIRGDVCDPGDVSNAVQRTIGRFGHLDIAVNCAGIISNTPIGDLTLAEWNRTLQVNLTGSFVFAQAALAPMVNQGSGRLILFSSVAARMGGVRSGPAYAAAKGGVLSMVRWTSRHVAPDGVTVNAVAPGSVRTPMTDGLGYTDAGIPLGRLGQPADLAETVVYLASDAAAWMTGQTIDVNGGIYLN